MSGVLRRNSAAWQRHDRAAAGASQNTLTLSARNVPAGIRTLGQLLLRFLPLLYFATSCSERNSAHLVPAVACGSISSSRSFCSAFHCRTRFTKSLDVSIHYLRTNNRLAIQLWILRFVNAVCDTIGMKQVQNRFARP